MRNAQVKASQAVAALLLLLSWMPVSAQSISSVTGTLQHNAQVTVVGSGFGTKTQAGPVVWDNMESGSFSPLWSSTGSPGTLNVNSDNQRHDNSHYNGMANFVGNQYVEHASFTGGSNSPRWYCQYWFKLGTDWNWGTATNGGLGSNLANVKFFRMWSTGSATDNWVCATEGWSNRAFTRVQVRSTNRIGSAVASRKIGPWGSGIFSSSNTKTALSAAYAMVP
ncbi:MAG: hypothetical protein IPP62_06085 [bacterium]|nr:hypothetical protein [bacterium]